MTTKDPLDELIVETFKAKSVWSGNTVRLTFKNPKEAMKFQNEIQKEKGCIIKEVKYVKDVKDNRKA